MRTLLAAAVVVSLAACQDDPGGFGDAKKTGHSDQPMDKTTKPPAPPPDFSKALQVQPAFDKATGQLTVVLKLAPGFHAYGPGEQIGKPVELAVKADNGWMVDG